MRILPIASILAAAAGCVCGATLSFTFTSSLLASAPGQTVTFSATLANSGPGALFLNADNVNITAPLILNDTKFFLNTPPALTAGQSLTAPILDVSVPVGTPFGLYVGAFDVLGGATASDFTSLASQPFAVQVVPEPGTMALLSGSLAGILLRRQRRRI